MDGLGGDGDDEEQDFATRGQPGGRLAVVVAVAPSRVVKKRNARVRKRKKEITREKKKEKKRGKKKTDSTSTSELMKATCCNSTAHSTTFYIYHDFRLLTTQKTPGYANGRLGCLSNQADQEKKKTAQ